jgi:sugar (pentulose or hexulose) kinase
MNDPLYTAEVERLKDCNKDYRPIAAQLAVYCSAAIFALRASNKELEDAQVKAEIIPDPFAAQAIDDMFQNYLEALRDYPELMAIALKFIQESR